MSKPSVDSIYPLSPSQRGMLFETLLASEPGVHIEQLVWHLRGALDARVLEAAWQHVVERHEVLRTCFVWKQQPEPVQVVLPRVNGVLRQEDLRGLEAGEQRRRLEAALEEERRRGFKPARAPLMRWTLFRTAEEEHQLLWTFHHLLMDGWSLPLVLQDVRESYQALRQGRSPTLGPSRPYRDHVMWLKRQDTEAAQAFWSARMRGFTHPSPLGREVAPSEGEVAERGYGVQCVRLERELTATLQERVRRHHLTMSGVLQGLWGALLSRYGGRADVVFGATVSGRPPELEGVESIVGPFINTLPVRLHVQPALRCWPWLQELHAQRVGQRSFEYCSAGQVQQWSEVAGALPLYESILVYESYPMEALHAEGRELSLGLADLRSIGARTRYPLTLIVIPGGELEVRLIHERQRVGEVAAQRMGEHLLGLLRQLARGGEELTLGGLLEFVSEEQIPRLRPRRQDTPGQGLQPRSPLEKRLATLWADVLGVEQVGLSDNFFALGGHSLLATRIIAAVSEAFAVHLPLVSLFEAPTLGALAERIDALQRQAAPETPSAQTLPTLELAPARRYEPFPLTDIQQAYWIGRSGAYELGQVSTHIYFEIDGVGLELERLEQAWRLLIARHDMLRAVVLADGQQQVLEKVPPYRIELLELSGRGARERDAALEATRERMSHQVLRADQWPLFEIRASRLDERRVRLHVSLDALIADAWSMFRLFSEWAHLYERHEVALPPLELSFRDYVLAEAQVRHTALYQRSKEYWSERLESLPPAPELPLARTPESLEHSRFHRRSSRLDPASWRKLKERAAAAGLTPSAVLLAAFGEILACWSKEPRFTLNLTLFHRLPLHPRVNDIVGDFTSLNLLEVDHSVPESFSARTQRLQQRLWQDLDHRYFSGVRVLRELARRQGGTQRALMPVVFTSTLALGERGEEASVLDQLGEMVYVIGQTPQVWLDHQVLEQNGALVFNWDAIEALFPPGLLDGMFESYRGLLRELVLSDEAWSGARALLPPPEQLARREAVNATQAPIAPALLHAPFLEKAESHAREPAVIAPGGSLTYGELSKLARQLGHQLREAGARPNTLVAVMMEKGWEQVVAVLGVLMSGAAYLPIDSRLPAERRRLLLEQGEVGLVVTQPWLERELEWPAGLTRLCVRRAGLDAADPGPVPPVQGVDDLAYVIFTSGSTGIPKGVMIDHRGAVNTIRDINARFGVGPGDRVLALSELGFDLSVYDLFGLLAAGGTIVFPSSAEAKDPSHWAELMAKHRVTVWNTVPALMQMLVEHLSGRAEGVPSGPRLMLLSGEWVPVKLPDRVRALWPETRVVSLGGATEASIWSIAHPIERVEPTWVSIPYGKPLANQRFHVLNAALEPAPEWVTGHLYIGGVGLAKGYWRDPEKTAARFIVHPRTGERLYKTGDLGRYWPDGNIEFLGREDFQVKLNGYRIELGEIEAALQAHPALREAAVTVAGEPGGARQLVAYVIPREERSSELAEVRDASATEVERTWRALVEAGLHQARQPEGTTSLETFASLWRDLDALYVAALCGALHELGAYRVVGERHDVDELMTRCRVAPRYRKWLQRGLKVLVEEGLLRQRGDSFESVRALPEASGLEHYPRIREQLARGLGFSEKETAWFLEGVQRLPRVLTDSWSSAETYAADETLRVYQKLFLRCNEILAEALRAVSSTRASDVPLRILEVGAGYGSTTEHVLPLLPPRTTYVFTDISRFFLSAAQERFARYPFVQYGLLDLETSSQAQGYEPHSFDVVIASSVLHDVRDIRQGLNHLRTLLSPGGVLLMIEETRFFRSFDLLMGLQQGFDRFEDLELRPTHPLLPDERWRAELQKAGFVESAVLSHPGSLAHHAGFEVLAARSPLTTRKLRLEPLRAYLDARLPEYMVPSLFIPLEKLPLTRNGKVDRTALPVPGRFQAVAAREEQARTETERLLATLWERLLGLEQVDIHANFFNVGGDSLLATRLAAQVREAYQVELPLSRLYERPTITSLAEYVDTVSQAHQWGPAGAGVETGEREEGEL